jgi:acyl carrier protein
MNDKTKILERLRQTIPRLAPEFIPERRLDELGADSIDMVELLVVIDSDFGVRLKEDEFLRLVTVDDLLRLIVERQPEHAL